MNRTARAMIGLAAVTMGVAAPAYGDDGGTSVVGWEGTSDISHSVKHPERQVTLTGVHGKQYRLQLKTADGWRTADVGQVDPGATTLLVTLPETWRSRANSAWRLKLSAPRVGALYTGSWKIHRTPRRARVDCAAVKCAALTFDDGPSDHTRRYLEILERHDAVATFFVIGSQVANRSGVLKKAAYQGNEIASHTWDHRALTSLTEGQIRSEVRRTAREIEKATGVRPALVRPPYGRIDGRVAGVLGSVGAAAILWSVDTRDWEHRNGAKVLRSVERHTQRGAIVLMHDLHSASADALDEMIQTLEDRGYTLVTVSEILGGNPKPGKIYRAGLK